MEMACVSVKWIFFYKVCIIKTKRHLGLKTTAKYGLLIWVHNCLIANVRVCDTCGEDFCYGRCEAFQYQDSQVPSTVIVIYHQHDFVNDNDNVQERYVKTVKFCSFYNFSRREK